MISPVDVRVIDSLPNRSAVRMVESAATRLNKVRPFTGLNLGGAVVEAEVVKTSVSCGVRRMPPLGRNSDEFRLRLHGQRPNSLRLDLRLVPLNIGAFMITHGHDDKAHAASSITPLKNQ